MNRSSLFSARRAARPTVAAFAALLAVYGTAAGQAGRIGPRKNAVRPTEAATPDTSTTPRPKPFDYSGWNALLGRYVEKGFVRYAAWKKDGTQELDAVLARMAAYPYPRVLGREDRLAFLLNAYNANVIRSVLEAYPIASVKDVPGFFDGTKHPLAGGAYTLDDIEKTLIGGTFDDFPMRHFALVCGARGCPLLAPRAYLGDSLVTALGRQFQHFIADTTKVSYNGTAKSLRVSELFKWYARDFERGDQTIPRLVAPALSMSAAMQIVKEEPVVQYIPFDWRLNEALPAGASPAGGGK